jgi:hypothetical protein
VDAAFEIFASAVMAACPHNFTEGFLVASVADGFSDIRYDCNINGKRKTGLDSDMEQDLKVDDVLHDLRKSMTISGQTPWSRCIFTLFPDGKFKFDVEYED